MGPGWGHLTGLIFGLAGLAFGFTAMCFGMWRRYRREVATLELLRTYAAQGKEPPAEVAKILQTNGRSYGRYREWRGAITLGCLAAAFAGLAYFSEGVRPHHGFVVAAVIVGALALGYALSGLLQLKHDRR